MTKMNRLVYLGLAGALALACWLGAAAVAADEELEELKLELPKPMFKGTPENIESANLEPPRQGPPPAVLVPKGTINLSRDKEVSASDEEPIVGELAFITDGDKEGNDGSFVELGPGQQWVQIDLGAPARIHAIALWHFHSQARVYRDVVIQTADDPDFIENVVTIFNNDHDNSAGIGVGKDKEYVETFEGRLIPVEGVEGRYVRLYSNGNTSNDLNHYVEVEVYGKPVE